MTAVDHTPTTPSAAPRLISRADVRTDAPARYAKQLVSHLGRKVPFFQDGATWTARAGSAVLRITVGDGVLVLQAEAADPESLAPIEHALGSHLERFGQRAGLTVHWERDDSRPA
jgi:uncharacterized protein